MQCIPIPWKNSKAKSFYCIRWIKGKKAALHHHIKSSPENIKSKIMKGIKMTKVYFCCHQLFKLKIVWGIYLYMYDTIPTYCRSAMYSNPPTPKHFSLLL